MPSGTASASKAPRGFGWLTNPKRAAYNRIYYRTTRGCMILVVPFLGAIVGLVWIIAILARLKPPSENGLVGNTERWTSPS